MLPKVPIELYAAMICSYTYQLPPGRPNHTCGGANIWADVGRSREIFCSSGSFCPTMVEEVTCGSGYLIFFQCLFSFSGLPPQCSLPSIGCKSDSSVISFSSINLPSKLWPVSYFLSFFTLLQTLLPAGIYI